MKVILACFAYLMVGIWSFAYSADGPFEIVPASGHEGEAGDEFRFKYPISQNADDRFIFQLFLGQGDGTYSTNCKKMEHDSSDGEYYYQGTISQAGERKAKLRVRTTLNASCTMACTDKTECAEDIASYVVKVPKPVFKQGSPSNTQINEEESIYFTVDWQHNYERSEPKTYIVDVQVRYRIKGSSSWITAGFSHQGNNGDIEKFQSSAITFDVPGKYEYEFVASSAFELNSSNGRKNQADWQGAGEFTVRATKFPDLMFESVTVDNTSIPMGEKIEIKAEVKNDGDKVASASTVRFYRSSDETIDRNDTLLGTDDIASLAINDTARSRIDHTFVDHGLFYLGACVDTVSGEVITGNNCYTGPQVDVYVPSETIRVTSLLDISENIVKVSTSAQAALSLSRVSFAIYDASEQVIDTKDSIRVNAPQTATYNSDPKTWGFNPSDRQADTAWEIDISELANGQYFIRFFATDGRSSNGLANTDLIGFSKTETSTPSIQVSPESLMFSYQRQQSASIQNRVRGIKARNIKRDIRFGQGRYVASSLDAQAKAQRLAQSSGGYVLMQFNNPVTAEVRQTLKANGFTILDYVPNNTYWVHVHQQALSSGLVDDIFWVGAVSTTDKVEQALVDKAEVEQRLKVHVKFFDDVSKDNALRLLQSINSSFSDIKWQPNNVTSLTINAEALWTLAALQQIQWIEHGDWVETTHNTVAAQRIHVDDLQAAPLHLSGDGIKVGVWDGDQPFIHDDFGNRVSLMERDMEISDHATHVIGTLAGSGSGDVRAKGMAPSTQILSYSKEDDITEMHEAVKTQNIVLSNHSYGRINGWYWSKAKKEWKKTSTSSFGQYTLQSEQWDALVRETQLAVFKAAGNDRGDGPDCDATDIEDDKKQCDGPFSTIGPKAAAKNVITICATEDNDSNTDFSSWGPTRDGRIKPDLCANGRSVYSTLPDNTYGSKNGTSMASPSAAGAGVLLFEHFENTYGRKPTAAELKGLMIHGAKDLSDTGPDYETGWGLIDAQKSAELITDKVLRGGLIAQTGGVSTFNFTLTDSQTPIKFTLTWTDPEASASTQSDTDSRALVNNLDLVLIDPQGNEHYSWVLDPSDPDAPATTGRNDRDNVEQVLITENISSGQWQVRVEGTLLGEGPQPFIVVSELLDSSIVLTETFTISNTGDAALTITGFDLQEASSWLRLLPNTIPIRIERGEEQQITIEVDVDKAPMGNNEVQVLIHSNDTTNSPYGSGVYVTTNITEWIDSDGDGIVDDEDNCINLSNPNQRNTDGDSLGDACDPDDDNDGVPDENDAYPLDGDRTTYAQLSELVFDDQGLRNCVSRTAEVKGWETIDQVEELNCYNEGLVTLDGIDAFEFLKTLSLIKNNLSDISAIGQLTHLTDLDIRKNQIIDISPLSKLTGLSELRISNNQIADLSPLASLTDLRLLKAEQNQIEDVSPLEQLVGLESLDLSHNRIADLKGLALLVNLGYLDVSHNQVIELSPLSGLVALEKTDLSVNQINDIAPLSELKELEDINLEQNRVVNVDSLGQLPDLQYLKARSNQIVNIAQIANATQLRDLDLRKNNINDISALAGLQQLTHLRLSGNAITGLSPLSGLVKLTFLTLSNNAFEGDIRDLVNLNRLTHLYLEGNSISDIETVGTLSKLTLIKLGNNEITDIEPLFGLANLKTIGLKDNSGILCTALERLIQRFGTGVVSHDPSCVDRVDLNVFTDKQLRQCVAENVGENGWTSLGQVTKLNCKDFGIIELQGIEFLTQLQKLDLRVNKIEDVTPIGALTSLVELKLARNHITNIESLAALTVLNTLSLSENKLSKDDLAVIGKLSELSTLYLRGNGIDDTSFIANLGQLTSVYLYDNAIADLSVLAEVTSLRLLELEANPITDIRALNNSRTVLERLNLRQTALLSCLAIEQLEINHPSTEVMRPAHCIEVEELSFADVSLDKCVKEQALDAGVLKVSQMDSLSCKDKSITSIKGLDVLTALADLDLRVNQISSVKPLERLRNLTHLRLTRNEIKSMTPVRRLKDLQLLTASRNAFEGDQMRWLAQLTKLHTLYLKENSITDISALAHLVELDTLRLENNRLADVSPLYHLKAPQDIRLTDNPDIPCQQLSELVNLFGEQVVTLSPCEN